MSFASVAAIVRPDRGSSSEGFRAELIQQFVVRRRALGISQMELDHRIGVAEGLVAKWESGARRPTLYNAWCWAKALGAAGFTFHFPDDGTLEH